MSLSAKIADTANLSISSPQNQVDLEIKCPQHSSKHFAYFCLSQNCQIPLCLDCQQSHSLEHYNTGTPENYVSFSKHVSQQSETLRILLEKSKTIKSVIANQLKQKRQKYLKVVNDHFDALQKSATQIQMQPGYLQEIQKNYRDLQEGKVYIITETIRDENTPQFVDNFEGYAQFIKNSVYIKPGIQIVSNDPDQGRKRHHSEKINFPKAHWVDPNDTEERDMKDIDIKSHGDKTQVKIFSSQRLSFGTKKESSQKPNKKKETLFGIPDTNKSKSFQIRDQKPENILSFKNNKASQANVPQKLKPMPIIQLSKQLSSPTQEAFNNPEIAAVNPL